MTGRILYLLIHCGSFLLTDVSDLNKDDKREIQFAFDSQVKNGSRGLSQRQARLALLRLGIKPIAFEIENFWFSQDKTEDDLLTLDEFMKLRCSINSDPKRVLRWAFNRFDTNNDGIIDQAELKKLLTTVYEDADEEWVDDNFVRDCLTLADDNSDGVLQIEEFVDMLLDRTGKSDMKPVIQEAFRHEESVQNQSADNPEGT